MLISQISNLKCSKIRLRIFYILFLVFNIFLAGCQSRAKRDLLSVDFKPDRTLRYKQVSDREIKLDFDPSGKMTKGSDKGRIQTINEKLEMVVAYKTVDVDRRGFSTIDATFESVKPFRSSLTGRHTGGSDALNFLSGKSMQLTISPSGIIVDPCGFDAMTKELGKQAFGGKDNGGIKDPDMIEDFLTLQKMMWDAVSSLKKPAAGVVAGQKWQSLLMAPMPTPIRSSREITYQLENIRDVNGVRIADINSTCKLSNQPLSMVDWPIPYTGAFRMRGLFGFLSGYKVLSLTGTGTQRYNIDVGRVEQIDQQYEASISADMPFALGSSDGAPTPNMVIKQKLSIELLK